MTDHNTLLNSLTDEELLRHFRAEHDPLTSTPIADELAKRFEVLLDLQHARLVKVLDEHDITDPDELTRLIERFGDRDGGAAEMLELIDAREDISIQDDLAHLFTRHDKMTEALAKIQGAINDMAN